MCKIISSDVVIGNFLLESVQRNSFVVSIEKMITYDEKLSERLEAHNYFTRFNFDEILDFKENYPFFVKAIEANHIKIFNEADSNSELAEQMGRYFRIGMPKFVIREMESASKSVFDME